MKYTETTIKSDRVYEGKILNLRLDTVELPDQQYSKREIVEHDDVSVIIPFVGEKVLLLEHFRKPFESCFLEVPSGMIEKDETPIDAARRELQEETGYIATQLEYLSEVCPSPGYSTEKMYFFKAVCGEQDMSLLDFDEHVTSSLFTMDELREKIENMDIKDMKTMLAYYLVKENHGND